MRQYTEYELNHYWMARCPECGWKGLSVDCNGFAYNGQDYDDGYCPKCDTEIEDDNNCPKNYIIWIYRYITLWAYGKKRHDKKYEEDFVIKMHKEYEKEKIIEHVYQLGYDGVYPDWLLQNINDNKIIIYEMKDANPLSTGENDFVIAKTNHDIGNIGDYVILNYGNICIASDNDMNNFVTQWHNDKATKLTLQQYLGMNDLQFQRFIIGD